MWKWDSFNFGWTIRYPGYQRFFLACDGEFRFVGHRPTRVRPKAEDSRGEAARKNRFSRGSLFKTWPKPQTAHEKPLAPRVRKRCNTITLFKLRGRRINNLSSWRNCFCAGGGEGARKFKASPHHSPHGFAGPLPKQERREVMTSQKPNFWNCMRLVGKSW